MNIGAIITATVVVAAVGLFIGIFTGQCLSGRRRSSRQSNCRNHGTGSS